jgi:hypothetical protein
MSWPKRSDSMTRALLPLTKLWSTLSFSNASLSVRPTTGMTPGSTVTSSALGTELTAVAKGRIPVLRAGTKAIALASQMPIRQPSP